MARTQKNAAGDAVPTDTPAYGCFEGPAPEKPAKPTAKTPPAPAKASAIDTEGDN